METVLSVASKLQLEEYIITDGLNQEMLDTMTDYLMTLHSVSESSKYQYLERLRRFGLWLVKSGIGRFVNVKKADIALSFINYLPRLMVLSLCMLEYQFAHIQS